MNTSEILTFARELITRAGIDSADLDAELIIAYALGKDRAYLLAHGDQEFDISTGRTIKQLIEKRSEHMPLAYIVGHKEFFGADFLVNKYTLIPRPETERLVQTVIDYCKAHPEKRSIVELGLGSGCVLLSILKNCPQLDSAIGIEFVKRGLEVARHNAERLGLLDRIIFKRSNMWQQLTKNDQFDIVVANLPYLSAPELAAARVDCPELSYEPQIALLGGTDGLLFFEKFFQRVHRHIRPNAAIFLEIGAYQAKNVAALAQKYLPQGKVSILKDDCARDRVFILQT